MPLPEKMFVIGKGAKRFPFSQRLNEYWINLLNKYNVQDVQTTISPRDNIRSSLPLQQSLKLKKVAFTTQPKRSTNNHQPITCPPRYLTCWNIDHIPTINEEDPPHITCENTLETTKTNNHLLQVLLGISPTKNKFMSFINEVKQLVSTRINQQNP